MRSTAVSRAIHASRAAIYRACTDPDLIVRWRFADMDAAIQSFDAKAGRYRMSLTYRDGSVGKTGGHTDSFDVRFIAREPDTRVVEEIVFDSADARFGGAFRMTTTLGEAGNGTRVTVPAENLPPAVRPENNETGTRMALAHLARPVE